MDIRDSQRIKEIRDNTAKMADAFTRIADTLERLANRKTEPTISKMEQVDKDINVRSKDEPQTEDEILREQCRDFMSIVEQTEREGE